MPRCVCCDSAMSVVNPRRGRRSVVAALSLTLGSSLALLPAPAAHAAGTPFIVIGTSDVSDSNLVAAVIEPRFEAEYPQYDLQYVAKGTGAAITDARAGNAAALIVHAASIENQFVGDGYSLEQYGRLVFWGDYILAGPASDPAGVLNGGATDIVTAFEKVAAAGAAGQASFVTRGGTPGTAVQERAIWAMTNLADLCTVGNPSGGGKRPTDGSNNLCTNPDDTNADPSDGAPYPTWYGPGNAGSQALNVGVANTCASGPFPNGNCYVFTDRGTLKYLQSTGAATNLKILTRNNSPSARGGTDALVNVFHAYGVNPAKFANPSTTKTDPVAAKLFLDFMTSSTTQAAIGQHLAAGGDPAFIPAANPKLTGAFTKDTVTSGKKVKIKGNVANVVPGYPALSGVSVNLLQSRSASPLSLPEVVATTTTDATGNYKFKTKLEGGQYYRVGFGQISKIELPALNPPFGDLLSGTSTALGTVGGITIKEVSGAAGGRVAISGKVKASASATPGKLVLYAGHPGAKLKKVDKFKVKVGKSKFHVRSKLGAGTWRLQLAYSHDGVLTVLSRTQTVKLS
jgi:tungstate transport system substrate-binding protein